jgi:hypothetical protein
MTVDDEQRRRFRVLEAVEELKTFISKLILQTSRLIRKNFVYARTETMIHNDKARIHGVPHSSSGWAAMMWFVREAVCLTRMGMGKKTRWLPDGRKVVQDGADTVLIREHGKDATLEAAQRADAMLEKGSLDGQRVWSGCWRR